MIPEGQGSGSVSQTSSVGVGTAGTHTHSVSVNTHSGSSGAYGGNDPVDNRPKFTGTQFIIYTGQQP